MEPEDLKAYDRVIIIQSRTVILPPDPPPHRHLLQQKFLGTGRKKSSDYLSRENLKIMKHTTKNF